MLSKDSICVDFVYTTFLSLALILIRIGNLNTRTLSSVNIITGLSYLCSHKVLLLCGIVVQTSQLQVSHSTVNRVNILSMMPGYSMIV